LFKKLPSTLADLGPGKRALVQGTLLWRVTAYVFVVTLQSFRKKRRTSRYAHCEVHASPSRSQSSGMWRWVAGQIDPDIFKVKQSKKRLLDPEEDGDATLRLIATTQLHIPQDCNLLSKYVKQTSLRWIVNWQLWYSKMQHPLSELQLGMRKLVWHYCWCYQQTRMSSEWFGSDFCNIPLLF